MTNASAGMTGIEITGKISIFLFFYFFLFKPQIEVDGAAHTGKWNSPTMIAAAPGQHQVEVSYKMYWLIPVNVTTMSVTVPDGGVVRLEYKPSMWGMLGKGKLAAA
jgi:hypothetical protein